MSEDEQAKVIAATVRRLNDARKESRCWQAKADLAGRHWDYTAQMLRCAADGFSIKTGTVMQSSKLRMPC